MPLELVWCESTSYTKSARACKVRLIPERERSTNSGVGRRRRTNSVWHCTNTVSPSLEARAAHYCCASDSKPLRTYLQRMGRVTIGAIHQWGQESPIEQHCSARWELDWKRFGKITKSGSDAGVCTICCAERNEESVFEASRYTHGEARWQDSIRQHAALVRDRVSLREQCPRA